MLWVYVLYRVVATHTAYLRREPGRSRELFGAGQVAAEQAVQAQLVAAGGSNVLTVAVDRGEGEPADLEVSKVALPGGDGAVEEALSVARDASRRSQDDQRLRLWGHAFRQAGIDIVPFDPREQKIMAANPAFAARRGYAPDDMVGMSVDGLYPPELRAARAEVREVRDGAQDHWSDETEHIARDGRRFPVQLDVSVIRDDDGTPLYALVYVHDISARGQAERELGIAAVAFDTAEAMPVTDANHVIQRVNDAFIALAGYARSEVIGQVSDRLLRSDHGDEALVQVMWDEVQLAGHWAGERWIGVNRGQSKAVRMTISCVKGSRGEITHHVHSMADIGRERAALASVDHLTFYDQLTGWPNRVYLRGKLRHLLHAGRRRILILFDLDHLKRVNDLREHSTGDALITSVANRLQAELGQDHLFCHMGGGTFVVIPNLGIGPRQSADRLAHDTAERVRVVLRDPFQLDRGAPIPVAVSMGWAVVDVDQGAPEAVLKQAELAMYRAKAAGRDRACRFGPEMEHELERSERLLAELRRALAARAFELYPQAQFDAGGRVVGAEMLPS